MDLRDGPGSKDWSAGGERRGNFVNLRERARDERRRASRERLRGNDVELGDRADVENRSAGCQARRRYDVVLGDGTAGQNRRAGSEAGEDDVDLSDRARDKHRRAGDERLSVDSDAVTSAPRVARISIQVTMARLPVGAPLETLPATSTGAPVASAVTRTTCLPVTAPR